MSNHAQQIAFVEARDGKAAAIAYAKQTLRAYRSAARPQANGRKHFAHILPFRPHFVTSVIYIRSYLAANQQEKGGK